MSHIYVLFCGGYLCQPDSGHHEKQSPDPQHIHSGLWCIEQPKVIDNGLPQKHEENGVAKAKTRGNIGDTYDIKSNKAAGKKQMLWRLNNLCQRDATLHC